MKASCQQAKLRFAFCVIWLWIDTSPVLGQSTITGRVVVSSAGEVGQRQANVPLTRINGRIQNRIPSRLRQRIDRSYDPYQIDASSQVETAKEQARTAGRSGRR